MRGRKKPHNETNIEHISGKVTEGDESKKKYLFF